jgi:hypothetical protein
MFHEDKMFVVRCESGRNMIALIVARCHAQAESRKERSMNSERCATNSPKYISNKKAPNNRTLFLIKYFGV